MFKKEDKQEELITHQGMMMIRNLFSCLLVLALLSACDKAPKPFSQYLDDLGFSFYNPPRTDRGPGSVFHVTKAFSGRKVLRPVCSRIYEFLTVHQSPVAIPNENSSDNFSIGFGLNLVKDLRKTNLKADAGLSRKANFKVTFGQAVNYYIQDQDLYNKDGKPRRMTPSCFSALRRLKKRDELKNVFIIQGSIRVEKMKYRLVSKKGKSLKTDVKISKLVNLKPDIKSNNEKELTLEINNPRYLAYRAYKIEDFLETGLTTAGSAVIRAKPVSAKDMQRLLGSQGSAR